MHCKYTNTLIGIEIFTEMFTPLHKFNENQIISHFCVLCITVLIIQVKLSLRRSCIVISRGRCENEDIVRFGNVTETPHVQENAM